MQWHKLTLLLAFAFLRADPQTAVVPTKMISMIVQMSGTDIPADSFAAKPKVIWRASNQYCRIDEEPDTASGIHGRMIINEPDAWLVNLADSTARHIVDKGPTFNCKLPIFATDEEMAKSKIGELEFGREIKFFQANGAKSVDGPKLSFKTDSYELRVGDSILSLVERDDIHAPLTIGMISATRSLQVRYLLWDDQTPFKRAVFAKPGDVTIEEAK